MNIIYAPKRSNFGFARALCYKITGKHAEFALDLRRVLTATVVPINSLSMIMNKITKKFIKIHEIL